MKTLKNYIFEYNGLISQDRFGGTPDAIHLNGLTFKWSRGGTYAFILNKKNGEILYSAERDTHNDIIETHDGELWGYSIDSVGDLRYCGEYYEGESGYKEDVDDWKESNKEVIENIRLGRIFIIELEVANEYYNKDAKTHTKVKSTNRRDTNLKNCCVFIAWWNELEDNEFEKLSTLVMKDFGDYKKYNILNYYAIGNNGEVIQLSTKTKSNVKIDKRSKDRKAEMEIVKNIHLASQKEKRKYFEQFRKNRAEKQAKEIEANKQNKSKTLAEQHLYVKNSDGSYRKYYGDSLVDFVKNFVNESSKKEAELMNEYAKTLIKELKFSKQDIEDEVNFYEECELEADKNDTIYSLFYKLVDIIKHNHNIGKFDASTNVKDNFNKLIINNI